LAEGGINQSAAEAAPPGEESEEPVGAGADRRRKGSSGAKIGRR